MALHKKKQEDNNTRRANIAPSKNVPAYSYHNVRSEQEANFGRDIKKASINQLKTAKKLGYEKFGLIILAVVVVICLISTLSLSSSSQVVLEGNKTNPIFTDYKSELRNKANKLLSSSILNSNKITVDTKDITETLMAEFPMYSNISISLPLINHHPTIYLTPAQPAIVMTNSAGQYVTNENGQVMLSSRSSTGFNYLKLPEVSYPGNSFVGVGHQVLTNQEVQFVQTIVYELALKNNKISSMSIPQSTSELDVHLSNETYYVKFNLQDNDPRQQAGSFLAAQNYLKSQNITPGQYIDVETDGRVYYQ